MEAKQTNFSILMFPWLAHGHIYPHLELAKNLSKKNFNIFFCSTAINLTSIKDDITENTSIQLVELVLPDLPDLPPPYHTTKNIPPNLMPKLFEAFGASVSTFSNIITSLKPDLLIFDAFQPWAAKIASSLGIPAIHFATTGAAACSFVQHGVKYKNPDFPYENIYLKDHEIKAFKEVEFPGPKAENDHDFVLEHFWLSADIILMRTCRAIEGKYIDYLSELCRRKVVHVGPLVTQGKSEENHSEIMEWLSKKEKFSTIFISFGSENYLSKDQMNEVAKGLEASDVNFIWVVRFPHGERVSPQEIFPNGFLERVKDRGMLVEKWAPQAEILAHSSVGAFVSHCGMSSMIEGIYYGVPIIAVPFNFDQPVNARLVVEAGVGVEVERDENGRFTGKDVEDAINKAITQKTGEEMRLKAAELSEKMKNEEENAVNEAAEQLRRICMEYKQKK